MKAEEYLKENRFESAEYAGYDVAYEDAKEAVKMERKEMEEKAINAFASFVEDYSHEAGFTEIRKESEHYIKVFTKMMKDKR